MSANNEKYRNSKQNEIEIVKKNSKNYQEHPVDPRFVIPPGKFKPTTSFLLELEKE